MLDPLDEPAEEPLDPPPDVDDEKPLDEPLLLVPPDDPSDAPESSPGCAVPRADIAGSRRDDGAYHHEESVKKPHFPLAQSNERDRTQRVSFAPVPHRVMLSRLHVVWVESHRCARHT